MSNIYTFRVDAVDGITRDRVVQFCRHGGYDDYVVVFEIAKETGKPHYQGYVKTDVKHQAYQKRVQAAFPEVLGKGKGNRGKYSAGVVRDFDSYSRYIMKGTDVDVPDVVCSSKQLELRECWAKARAAEADKAKKNHEGRDDSKSVLQRGIEHFKGVVQTWPADMDQRAKYKEVARWLVRDFCQRGKAPNVFLIRNYVAGILNPIDESSFEYFVNLVIEKL